jgi:hypothetical protein
MLWLVVYVAGAVGGALCDQIHVQSGVLAYPHPAIADQAWWFVAARLAARDHDAPSPSRVALDAGWFLAIYAASGIWHEHPVALTIAFVATWALRRPDRRRAVLFSLALAVGGVVYEGTLAATGAFHYRHADLYHVPMWLAGIYLHGALLALSVGRAALRHRPVAEATALRPR